MDTFVKSRYKHVIAVQSFLTPGLSFNMDTRQWRRCFNIDAFQTEKRQSQKTKQIEKFKSKNSLNMCT